MVESQAQRVLCGDLWAEKEEERDDYLANSLQRMLEERPDEGAAQRVDAMEEIESGLGDALRPFLEMTSFSERQEVQAEFDPAIELAIMKAALGPGGARPGSR